MPDKIEGSSAYKRRHLLPSKDTILERDQALSSCWKFTQDSPILYFHISLSSLVKIPPNFSLPGALNLRFHKKFKLFLSTAKLVKA
ncbi:unnamed protein product [Prunus armeniaca]